MAERLIKSALWLSGCSLLGYSLFIVCTPNEETLKDLPGVEKSPIEVRKRKQNFVDVLQSASSSNRPFYRLDKEQIEREIKKQN